MVESRRLPIDIGDLILAMEGLGGVDYTATSYLDLQTGNVFFISDFDVIEEMEEMAKLVETQPERFEAVPTLDTSEAYADLEAFVETVRNGRLAERLAEAIRGRGAFRRFRDTPANFPDEEQRWYAFNDERMRGRALGWLEELGIELLPRQPGT